MVLPERHIQVAPFDRMEEYKAILGHISQSSIRRQNATSVMVALNTVFLTGLGVLFVSTRFDSWRVVVEVAAFSTVVILVNMIWRAELVRSQKNLNHAYDYLREIERGFRERLGTYGTELRMGLFLRAKEEYPRRRLRSVLFETRLATYFVCLYLIAVLVAGALVAVHFVGLM